MTTPVVGQRATFYPGGGLPSMKAIVEHVCSSSFVNLRVSDGLPMGRTVSNVMVVDPDEFRPSGYYCTLAAGDVLAEATERMAHTAVHRMPDGSARLVPVTASIKGYRQLSGADQALINECKELAEKCGAMVARLRAMQPSPQSGPTHAAPSLSDPFGQASTIDQRWVSIGATDLQRGWMAVIRGIAQPTTF